ncbi:hypothetical protein HDA32_005133 [Spinactinospora alkalitolerans]|uniref:Uncharacterized protein n=1 Tax=Spinactinospora alkalitolerans TaxID=687207 RepID=A0A852U544_9ACTN|nr:hypothetical protein [Spinactinospora alkalitolerans]NYE50013.1 hypothetical protein [Spinactinospora alkalitolerans]
MAVLTVEIFAHAPEDTDPATLPEHDWIAARFRHALAPLACDPAGALPLIGYAITPYAGAAMVEAQCVTGSGTEAMDVIAARLEAAMQDHPDAFGGWHLHAGLTHIHMSDN